MYFKPLPRTQLYETVQAEKSLIFIVNFYRIKIIYKSAKIISLSND